MEFESNYLGTLTSPNVYKILDLTKEVKVFNIRFCVNQSINQAAVDSYGYWIVGIMETAQGDITNAIDSLRGSGYYHGNDASVGRYAYESELSLHGAKFKELWMSYIDSVFAPGYGTIIVFYKRD